MRQFILEFVLLGAVFMVLAQLMPVAPAQGWQDVLLHAAGVATAWLLLSAIYPDILIRTPLRTSSIHIGSGIVYGILVFGVMQAAAAIYAQLPLLPETHGFPDTAPLRLELSVPAMLLTGMREELFFRGWLQPRIMEVSGSEWTGIAVATLLFSAAHLPYGVSSAVFAGIGGLLFSLIRSRHNSVVPAGIAHGVYNVLVVALR